MSDKKFDSSTIAQMANAKSQGKRPNYFSDAMAEQTFAINMALMAELAVSRERVDTLERLLVQKGVLSESDVDSYVPDQVAAEQRQTAQVEYSARILRPIQQQVEFMQEKNPLSMDELADRLGDVKPSGNNNA